jgi:hypothetical protein
MTTTKSSTLAATDTNATLDAEFDGNIELIQKELSDEELDDIVLDVSIALTIADLEDRIFPNDDPDKEDDNSKLIQEELSDADKADIILKEFQRVLAIATAKLSGNFHDDDDPNKEDEVCELYEKALAIATAMVEGRFQDDEDDPAEGRFAEESDHEASGTEEQDSSQSFWSYFGKIIIGDADVTKLHRHR